MELGLSDALAGIIAGARARGWSDAEILEVAERAMRAEKEQAPATIAAFPASGNWRREHGRRKQGELFGGGND